MPESEAKSIKSSAAAPMEIAPVTRPIQARIRPPGSKSITNRALVLAALGNGNSRLTGVLDSQDTRVMVDGLRGLGIALTHDRLTGTAEVRGCAGRPTPQSASAELWLENSGTSIRFLTAMACLAHGTVRLDGVARMRQRPIGSLCAALNALGGTVSCEAGYPPVTVSSKGLQGGVAEVAADLSSQFLSALLMAAPCAGGPVELRLQGQLVSEPYVGMTVAMMREFGVTVDMSTNGCYRVSPAPYRGRNYEVEPDASAASYFFAAAAITGGTITVEGLSRNSLQGDICFVDVLERMGCTIEWDSASITVHGGPLQGVEVDMNPISDTAQTLAVVATFATGPTRIRNVAHIRQKETDRIAAVVTELRRLGIVAEEHDDGLTIFPGAARPALVETYDDHRMAMSFALMGLRRPGIEIANPGCVAKTYPRFFDDLAAVCQGGE